MDNNPRYQSCKHFRIACDHSILVRPPSSLSPNFCTVIFSGSLWIYIDLYLKTVIFHYAQSGTRNAGPVLFLISSSLTVWLEGSWKTWVVAPLQVLCCFGCMRQKAPFPQHIIYYFSQCCVRSPEWRKHFFLDWN